MKTTIHWRKWPDERPDKDYQSPLYVLLKKREYGKKKIDRYFWRDGIWLNSHFKPTTYMPTHFCLPTDIHHDAGGTDAPVL